MKCTRKALGGVRSLRRQGSGLSFARKTFGGLRAPPLAFRKSAFARKTLGRVRQRRISVLGCRTVRELRRSHAPPVALNEIFHLARTYVRFRVRTEQDGRREDQQEDEQAVDDQRNAAGPRPARANSRRRRRSAGRVPARRRRRHLGRLRANERRTSCTPVGGGDACVYTLRVYICCAALLWPVRENLLCT